MLPSLFLSLRGDWKEEPQLFGHHLVKSNNVLTLACILCYDTN